MEKAGSGRGLEVPDRLAQRGALVCEQAKPGVGARSQDIVGLEAGARVDLGAEETLGALDVPVQPELELGIRKPPLAEEVAARSTAGPEVLRRSAEPSCEELDRLRRGIAPPAFDPRDVREGNPWPSDLPQRQTLLDSQTADAP